MYLTISLIVLVPVSARLYRYLTARQVKRMLHEEFATPRSQDQKDPSKKR